MNSGIPTMDMFMLQYNPMDYSPNNFFVAESVGLMPERTVYAVYCWYRGRNSSAENV